MKLVRFSREGSGRPSVGILQDGKIADIGLMIEKIGGAGSPVDDILYLIKADTLDQLLSLKIDLIEEETPEYIVDAGTVALLPPLERPPKIVCVGRNYREHEEEVSRSGEGKDLFKDARNRSVPLFFAKAANSVIGPGDKILIPPESSEVDYEVELGVVIGKPGYRISPEQAPEHIFGYTVLNDVTARDLQRTEGQWYRAKSFATFCPIGPCIVTPEEIDPRSLEISLEINGELRQHSNTSRMIFDVYEIVSHLSFITPLEPGDLIGTGTPSGVGAFMDPPVYLKKGDKISATIEGIGTLENEVA